MHCVDREGIWDEFFFSCENSVDIEHQQSQPRSIIKKVVDKVFLLPPSLSYLNLLGEMGIAVEEVIEKLSYGRQQKSHNDTAIKSAVESSSASSQFSIETSKLFSGSVRLKFYRRDLIPFFNLFFSNILHKPHLQVKIKTLATMTDSNELICETDDMNIGITVGSSLLGSQLFITIACRAYRDLILSTDSMIVPFSPVANCTILKFLRFLRISANCSGASSMLDEKHDIINLHFSTISALCSSSIATASDPNEKFTTNCNRGNLNQFVELMYEIIVKTHEESNRRIFNENVLSQSMAENSSSQTKLTSYLSKTILERFRLQINTCNSLIPFIVSRVSHDLALSSLSSSSSSLPSSSSSSCLSSPMSPKKRCNEPDTANDDTVVLKLTTDRFLHKCLCILSFSYDLVQRNEKNEKCGVNSMVIDSTGTALLNQIKAVINTTERQSLMSVWRQIMVKNDIELAIKPNDSPALNSTMILDKIYSSDHDNTRSKLLFLTLYISIIDTKYYLKYNNRVKKDNKKREKKNKLEDESIDLSVSKNTKVSVQIENVDFVDEFFLLCYEVLKDNDYGEILVVLTSVISLFNKAKQRSIAFYDYDGCNNSNYCDNNDINDDGKRKRHRDTCNANVIFDSTQPEGDEVHDLVTFGAADVDVTNLNVTDSHCIATEHKKGLEVGPNSNEDRKNIPTDSNISALDSNYLFSSSTAPSSNLPFHNLNDFRGEKSELLGKRNLKSPSDSEFKSHGSPLLLDYIRENVLKTTSTVGMFFSIMETRSSLFLSSTNNFKSFDINLESMIVSVHLRLLSILHPSTEYTRLYKSKLKELFQIQKCRNLATKLNVNY